MRVTRIILFLSFVWMFSLQVSAQQYSQLEITDNNSQVSLFIKLPSLTQVDESISLTVGLELVSLGDSVNDIHDVVIDLKIESVGYLEVGQVSFLDRSTDSLTVEGDIVASTYRFTMNLATEGKYTISAKVTLREDISFASDPEYKSSWKTLTTVSYFPQGISTSGLGNSESDGVTSISEAEVPDSNITGGFIVIGLGAMVILVSIGVLYLSRSNSKKEIMVYNNSQNAQNMKKSVTSAESSILTCSHCGTKYDIDDSFCANCGSRLR